MPLASAALFPYDYAYTDTCSGVQSYDYYINVASSTFTYHQYADYYVTVYNSSVGYQTLKIKYAISPYQLETYDAVTWLAGDTIWIHSEYEITDPIIIGNVTQLQFIENITSANYVVNQSFDASSINFNPINGFTGTFDGMGYTISNFVCEHSLDDNVAMFGTSADATICNFTMTNVSVDGDAYVGAVIGYGDNVDISNIHVYGNVSGTNTIGLVGGMLRYASSAYRVVSGGNVVADSATYSLAGGQWGYFRDASTASECAAYGTLTANTGDRNGGFIGTASELSSFTDCYSQTNVSGDASNCGFCGKTDTGIFTNCYASGIVEGNSLNNGFVDQTGTGATISYCYYDVNTTNQTTSEGATGKVTSDMMLLSTYTGWDFDTIWQLEGYPILQFEELDYTLNPTILYPTNATEIDSEYPSLTSIQFIWSGHSGASSSSYQLSRDSNYNTLVSSGTTTNNYKTLSLDADDYYFRVRYLYDTDAYSDWAESQFSINTTVTDYGTAIQGVVYESSDGSYSALSNAKVTIYNDSWSDDYLTGSNGYYLFEDLGISDYYLTASKDGYETSSINIVNVTSAMTYTKDIYLEEENAPTYITPHYVKFIVTDTSYTRYADASVTIYIGDSATAYKTLTTGADGACGAELSEDVEYHIVCVYGGQTIDFMLTPTDTIYRIYLDTGLLPDRDRLAIEEIQITVTPSEINSTHANVHVSYVDNMSETTALYLFVNNSDGGVLASGNIYPLTTYNFTIPDYQGEDYIVIVKSTHDTFGTITRQYSIHFNDTSLDIGIWGTWIAAMCIMMIAMGAGKADADKAAGGILVIVFIFMAIGWLPHTLSFSTSYAVAFVLVVAWHMKNKDRSVSE